MQDRPDATDLLEAVEDFLRTQSAAASERWMRFQLLVAANTLGIVRRELLHEDEFVRKEWSGLDRLLGAEPLPDAAGDLRAAARRRNELLCERIRAGVFDAPEAEAALVAHLLETVTDQVRITSPAAL